MIFKVFSKLKHSVILWSAGPFHNQKVLFLFRVDGLEREMCSATAAFLHFWAFSASPFLSIFWLQRITKSFERIPCERSKWNSALTPRQPPVGLVLILLWEFKNRLFVYKYLCWENSWMPSLRTPSSGCGLGAAPEEWAAPPGVFGIPGHIWLPPPSPGLFPTRNKASCFNALSFVGISSEQESQISQLQH